MSGASEKRLARFFAKLADEMLSKYRGDAFEIGCHLIQAKAELGEIERYIELADEEKERRARITKKS